MDEQPQKHTEPDPVQGRTVEQPDARQRSAADVALAVMQGVAAG
jgi:hypothetical protein